MRWRPIGATSLRTQSVTSAADRALDIGLLRLVVARIFFLAWSMHTSNQSYGEAAFWAGLGIGNGGVLFTGLAAYRWANGTATGSRAWVGHVVGDVKELSLAVPPCMSDPSAACCRDHCATRWTPSRPRRRHGERPADRPQPVGPGRSDPPSEGIAYSNRLMAAVHRAQHLSVTFGRGQS